MLTFEKIFIEFHREFYFWERFEKRVFPTDPLSRTDTFGTHCTFTYGFESESRKRSLGAGYNCKAKKHCCVLPICLVFEGMKDSEKIKKPRHMYNASICYCIFVE
jgi:hypothetical protein